MKFALGVLAVAAVHFVVLFVVSFVTGTTGKLKFLAMILGFPLSVMNGPANLPPLLDWGAIVMLSLVWGIAVCYAARKLWPRR